MFTASRLSFGMLWFFGWRNIVRTALLSVAVYVAYEWLGWGFIDLREMAGEKDLPDRLQPVDSVLL